MPITVICECGKSFRVKDEYAGRKGLCPACKQPVTVPAVSDVGEAMESMPQEPRASTQPQTPPVASREGSSGGLRMPTGGVSRFGTAPARAVPQVQSPRFTMSPRAIIFFSLLIFIPLILFLGKIGPVRAMQQWQELEPKLEVYTHDAVQTVIMKEYEGVTFNEYIKPPKVTNIMLDGPIMMITLPKEIPVQGTSTEGRFKGTYFTRTKSFVLEVGVDDDDKVYNVKSHVDEAGNCKIDELKVKP